MVYNTIMNTQTQSHDILARLLATENVNVVRGNVRTASFDIKNRVLVLPRWKDMTPDLEQMLILHEVGHALFTSNEKYGKVFEKENSHLRGYANIIEDARIEVRMKERYPGCRKTFAKGYQELRDRDFFEVKNRDLSSLLLIDRINLYFKIGYNCGVTFTSEEQEFLRRVERCKSEDEVFELSAEIYAYCKAEKASKLEGLEDIEFEEDEDFLNGELPDGMYEISSDPSSKDDEDEDEQEPNPNAKSYGDFEDGVDPELQPETLEALESNLADIADSTLRFEYFEPDFQFSYQKKDVIIPFQRVISELKGSTTAEALISRPQVQRFKASTAPVVNYLIKEFEMKKSATAYKRARISKTGQINSNKLYAYKMKDDIFKQVLTVKDGKKHGMVFLIDWSGSMCNHIEETLEQVINLAMFCQKAQIAYQVFAFTDGYLDDKCNYQHIGGETNKKGLGSDSGFKLLEFFSSNMTNAEFNSMISLLLNRIWRFPNYGLNGTPLAEATMYMIKHLEEFKKNFQVEKLSFITLSDGEGSLLSNSIHRSRDGITYDSSSQKISVRAILQDPITKKEYSLGETANDQMIALRSVIQDRLDCKVIGFYIISNTHREIERFIKNNMKVESIHERNSKASKIQSNIKQHKYHVVEMPSYDEFYLLATLKIKEHDLDDVSSDMSAAAIANRLSKMMNTKKLSRVVLDKFIEKVA